MCLALACVATCAIPLAAQPLPDEVQKPLMITRPVRTWEFLCAVGKRAGIFGNESGRTEAWVYPLKILRDLHVTIHHDGKALPAESLVRTIEARPESTTLLYTSDTFRVRETFFVPVDEAGALILFEVETEHPLELEVTFQRDFQLEWPASIGGTYASWDASLNAFVFGEESKRFAAIVGSPTASEPRLEYDANYSASHESSFRLGVTTKGHDRKLVVLAGSVIGASEAEKTYKKLALSFHDLQTQSATYYSDYLRKTVGVELPDAQLQEAYDWSRVSLLQGLVANPTMGNGLIAGYRTSGVSGRPGFAWFFGRDSLWSSLALDSEGDFSTTRTALLFLTQFQREDGKIPHEIAQGASFVNWFKDYPYGFASADATPLYIIAANDYVTASGDTDFAKANWEHLWKAYQFLRSTYADGFPKNLGIGHGWVEGGPLLPVKSEFYQSGVAVEALRALSSLAKITGKEDVAKTLADESEKERIALNSAFWSAEGQIYAFALDNGNRRVDEASVLAAVPMWFGLLDGHNSGAMISQLARYDHSTDWGMRIISSKSPKFSGEGYHYGSVWPLFTGWASVGEYRYHRPQPGYDNLRSNALLALDGSPGHVTEVLSGDYYQPLSTSSPHQIWSAAMVINPMLRGLFGLQTNALERTLTLTPHLPADWSSFRLNHVAVGTRYANLSLKRAVESITLEIRSEGDGEYKLDFSPAIGPRAEVIGAEWNGRAVPFQVESTETDQHVRVRANVAGALNTLRIRLRNDFGISSTLELPALGSTSEGLRMLSEEWSANHDSLTLELQGKAGHAYTLNLWNPAQVATVEGGSFSKASSGAVYISVEFPEKSAQASDHQQLILHFVPGSKVKNRSKR